MNGKILVVDDDRFLQSSLDKLLKGQGYAVKTAGNADEAMTTLHDDKFDLMILDIGLPDADGISVCRRLRQKYHLPVIMLTARTDAMDKVIGLEVGADDYLTKPFEPLELLARVRAQLRRTKEYQAPPDTRQSIALGNLTLDYEKRDAIVSDKPVGLTNREFELLAHLAQNKDRALSRESVFETVWGYDMEFSSNSLDVYIYRIRKKIEDDPENPKYLLTMRGYGYKLVSGSAA